ncbi:hypothetical protein AVEN_93277-1 [Araneus ventricosus]|uniref:Uncharacterized protein n=1 Tax=Araneus ventricosus TaxID=182803 RepID=A0A4Y2D3E2_ARAVE|nr:hypothetical protein AVEN_93277-1 [Araneus ventricosus]
MQKVNEIFGFSSPKQLTTLDNKTLREEAATTLANLYPHDLEKDELAVEIESFKYSVIDESTTQYKNKKNFLNFCFHEEDFKVKGDCYFLVTEHGKGSCEGIGDSIKRLAPCASLQ